MEHLNKDEKTDKTPWFVTDTPSLLNYIDNRLGDAVDDLSDVIDALRADGHYELSDRLRTISGRIARLQKPCFSVPRKSKDAIRTIAMGWK